MSKGKIVVGMSGGVDSSVAAYLLLEQGYDVIGVTMEIWQEEDALSQEESGGCCGLFAAEDARRVASLLGIPHYVMNFRREFKEKVIDYFSSEYLSGRTPNPCIACNRFLKWGSLLDKAIAIGADGIATGHYARVGRLPGGRYAVRKSVTAEKDQTYALYSLTQEQLSRTHFPIGDYKKDEVRAIAGRIGLPVAEKKDSMEICFVPDGDYAGFIDRECAGRVPPPGSFVTKDGEVLGRHRGITHYTIGQRRGLGIAAGRRVFVTEIRPETNEVVLGGDEDTYSRSLCAGGVSWMARAGVPDGTRLVAKIRYSDPGAWCSVTRAGEGMIRCDFDKPVRAVTPGQAVVLYDGEYVAGGGTIIRGGYRPGT